MDSAAPSERPILSAEKERKKIFLSDPLFLYFKKYFFISYNIVYGSKGETKHREGGNKTQIGGNKTQIRWKQNTEVEEKHRWKKNTDRWKENTEVEGKHRLIHYAEKKKRGKLNIANSYLMW